MPTARVTTHKSTVVDGMYRVRYGTPSSFMSLGLVQKLAQGWKADAPSGGWTRVLPTKAEAVAYLVKVAGL